MERKQDERGHSGAVAIAVAGVLMLPVLYVLSAGPAEWLDSQGLFAEGGIVYAFYAPLRWLVENCQPFDSFLRWYVSFFVR